MADLNRIAAAAAAAFLGEDSQPHDRQAEDERSRFGGLGAVAVGVGLSLAARAAYRRLRRLDLAQVAGSVEGKLKG
jgi:hypothetical protein